MLKKILCLGLVGALTACSTTSTGRNQLMLVSPNEAITESKAAYITTMNDLDKQNKLVTDPKRVKRIHDITGRLVTEAVKMYPASKDWEWSVAIIDDPKTLNAWCMAGGRMAIYTGIIDQLKLTDDEIAQIMGHEISHALANHTAERMSRAKATAVGMGIAAIALGTSDLSRGTKAVALTGTALAAKLALELPNSRTAEAEADRIGIELAARAGYEPKAAVSLWDKMGQASGGKGGPAFLSTHPAPDNRSKTLGALGPEMKALNPNLKKAPIHPITIVK